MLELERLGVRVVSGRLGRGGNDDNDEGGGGDDGSDGGDSEGAGGGGGRGMAKGNNMGAVSCDISFV